MYVFCQNTGSQVQGEENAVALDGDQKSGEDRKDKKDGDHKDKDWRMQCIIKITTANSKTQQ